MFSDIKEQFKAVISYSQNIYDPKVDRLFDKWEKAKSKFIHRFGGLIYEWPEPVEFTLDKKSKETKVMEFTDYIDNTYSNADLANFIEENIDTFFDNVVSFSDKKEIPKGMKLIKAFKYFEKDPKVLEKLQNLASELIQENKIHGKLCFSVHPLDFLSSSQNSYNWRSCHSLDGEYRAGNLSYMVDTTTFMVYLKNEDEDKAIPLFGNVKWNSKKWRMLIHASNDDELIFAGRQYPFVSESGLDIVLGVYNNILKEQHDRENSPKNNESNVWFFHLTDIPKEYGGWRCDYLEDYQPAGQDNWISLAQRYVVVQCHIYDIRDIVVEGRGALNYNDILFSTCYKKPYYACLKNGWTHIKRNDENNRIVVGGPVPCLECGEYNIEDSHMMSCRNCYQDEDYDDYDSYVSCGSCGCRHHVDDSNVVILYNPYGGIWEEAVCDECYSKYCFNCPECGESFYKDSGVMIGLDANGDEIWICKQCHKEMEKEEGEKDNG